MANGTPVIYFRSGESERPILHEMEAIDAGRFVDKLSAITLAVAEGNSLLVAMSIEEMRVIEEHPHVFDFDWVVIVDDNRLEPYWANLARRYDSIPIQTLEEQERDAQANSALRSAKLGEHSAVDGRVEDRALVREQKELRNSASRVVHRRQQMVEQADLRKPIVTGGSDEETDLD